MFSLPHVGKHSEVSHLELFPHLGFPPGSWTDIWVVSTFWLLWLALLWPFVCKLLCRHVFVSLGDELGSGTAGSYGDSMLSHVRTCQAVFAVAAPFTPPPTPWGSHFLHILNTHGYEVVSISLCFQFTNLWWLVMVNIFPCALWPFVFLSWGSLFRSFVYFLIGWPFVFLPWRSLFRSFAYFLIGSFAFIRSPWQEFFTCSADKSLIRHKIGKYCLPFCRLAFHFLEREQKQPIEES